MTVEAKPFSLNPRFDGAFLIPMNNKMLHKNLSLNPRFDGAFLNLDDVTVLGGALGS